MGWPGHVGIPRLPRRFHHIDDVPRQPVDGRLIGGCQRLADFGSEFGLSGQLQHFGRQGDVLFHQDFFGANVDPRHLDDQIDLQFAGVAVFRLSQSVFPEVDDLAGEKRIGFRFFHQPKVRTRQDLFLNGFGQLVFEESTIARGFENRNVHRSNFRTGTGAPTVQPQPADASSTNRRPIRKKIRPFWRCGSRIRVLYFFASEIGLASPSETCSRAGSSGSSYGAASSFGGAASGLTSGVLSLPAANFGPSAIRISRASTARFESGCSLMMTSGANGDRLFLLPLLMEFDARPLAFDALLVDHLQVVLQLGALLRNVGVSERGLRKFSNT